MCYTCGCNKPYDTKGDPENIVETSFLTAGRTAAIHEAGKKHAKLNMLHLLQKELASDELENPREQYED